MKYIAYFLMNSFEDRSIPYTESYKFWKFIVSKALEIATDFEIRCWPNEIWGFEIGERFGETIINEETQEIVYKGKVSQEFIADVTTNYLRENTLKWFTISLLKDNRRIFSSEHYGTEIIFFNLSEHEKDALQKYTDCYPEVRRVNFYTEEI